VQADPIPLVATEKLAPIDAPAYDANRDGKRGANVIHQILHFEHILADKSATTNDRPKAMKFVVHLVGDIHQPLHCAERDGDKGGNSRLVFFLDQQKATNLHAVWVTSMLRKYIGRAHIADYADRRACGWREY
jgi:hypothetical protein